MLYDFANVNNKRGITKKCLENLGITPSTELQHEMFTSTFTDRQQEILNESGYTDLTRNCNQIINCAMLLSLGYIHEATTYAESCGGGGSPGSGWGRDKDEDYDHWWRRCIAVSAAMMRPAKYRMRRGR